MHVTSDYYRGGKSLPVAQDVLMEHSSSAVRDARKSNQVEPLRPSNCTMRRLARHYKDSRSLNHSA
ncbi:MAG: hypothetical protein ACJAS5_000477 [Lentimonas sp.]|jgi:hypothetical protein